MEKKKLKINGSEVTLRVSAYCSNDRVAIAMYDFGDCYSYGVATVNLEDELLPDNNEYAYMDEPNNPGITHIFEEAGLVTPTGYNGSSGYNIDAYPLVKLNLEEIAKYDSFSQYDM